MISIFGATYTPSADQLKYANKMAKTFGLSTQKVAWRKGGVYQVVQPLWSGGQNREVVWGRHVATFENTTPKTMVHEFGHIIQVHKLGWGAFQARAIYEQILGTFGVVDPYRTEGFLEYEANNLDKLL